MPDALLAAVRRFTDLQADARGVAATSIAGLSTLRADTPGELQYAISRPLVALVVQGRKRVMMGRQSFEFGAGDSMVIAADVPTISQVTHADAGQPYYSLVFELVPAVVESLVAEMDVVRGDHPTPIRVDRTEQDVADVASRLLRLLERPAAVPVLAPSLVREMHYWLLAGRHGPTIRHLGMADGHASRIARAVALIRSDCARPLRVEHLAAVAGMSGSTFNQHFRAHTSLSPLQFQKQLRLIEARRLMLSEGASASRAAHSVGYESVPQFTREYGRLFGASPVREIKVAKARVVAVA